MLRVSLTVPRGHVRLIDFTMEDVRFYRTKADGQTAGWKRRVKVMAEYEAMLTKYKAASGRALPPEAIERVRKYAAEAWA